MPQCKRIKFKLFLAEIGIDLFLEISFSVKFADALATCVAKTPTAMYRSCRINIPFTVKTHCNEYP